MDSLVGATKQMLSQVTDILNKESGITGDEFANKIVVIPDIHARPGFVYMITEMVMRELEYNRDTHFVFLGDYCHSEGRAQKRWKHIDNGVKKALDEEMKQACETLMLISELKFMAPKNVFLLKGNHDFCREDYHKYSRIGEPKLYRKWYDKHGLLDFVDKFEMSLPLAYTNLNNFIATHTLPDPIELNYDWQDIDMKSSKANMFVWGNYLQFDKNDFSLVREFGEYFIDKEKKSYWVVGHRPIRGGDHYIERTNGKMKFYQVNKPEDYVVLNFFPNNEEVFGGSLHFGSVKSSEMDKVCRYVK